MTALSKVGNKRMKDSFLLLSMFLLFITACNTTPRTKGQESLKGVSAPPAAADVKKKSDEPAIGSVVSADSLQVLLKGKWLRSDGTYTIEIFSVKENGKMDAGYFNPGPINVDSSVWSVNEGNILVEIVLRDANYPGSKYNLIYDRRNDLLSGNYFQAVQGINYDVIFTRNK
ncbi:MAG TPA: hypothetical protein DD745_08275 [Bacteroidales bacterium]|nr:hypothetical protein [Bacteroidales bacterium]